MEGIPIGTDINFKQPGELLKVRAIKSTIMLMIVALCGHQHAMFDISRYHILWHDKQFVFFGHLYRKIVNCCRGAYIA